MFKYYKIITILLLIILSGCNKPAKEISVLKDQNIEKQMRDAYEEGFKALEGGDVLFAAKKFNEAELLFPQSKWAPRAALMAGYSYYSQAYYGDAIYMFEQFIKTYPNSENISYAEYLIALCYYEKIVDEKKDLKSILDAKEQFEFIIKEYPTTEFAIDAKFKIDLINEILAAKEMYLARYYLNKEKWIPALNRFKTVVQKYNTTIYTEEALHRLVEINYRLGLIEESKKYANTLGYNYQSSGWYKNSYKIFNKDYRDGIKELQKDKKKKLSFIKKFKGLFE